MSTAYRLPLVLELRHEVNALRGNWLWFVVLGGALIVLGCIALGSVVAASLATAVVIGVLMLMGGAAEIVGAFWCRGWSGFFFQTDPEVLVANRTFGIEGVQEQARVINHANHA